MSPRQNTRLSLLSIGIGLTLAVAAAGSAAQGTSRKAGASSTGSGSAASMAAADKTFAMTAAAGGLAEVALGKLAQQNGSNDQVKQFGSRMVDDHSKANDELKQIASSKGITLPTDVDAKHKSELAKMQKLTGAQFDRAYMDSMVKDHKEDVSEFHKESTAGKDSDIKAFAAKTLPTLQDHLKMAQSTDAAVKNTKTTASR